MVDFLRGLDKEERNYYTEDWEKMEFNNDNNFDTI